MFGANKRKTAAARREQRAVRARERGLLGVVQAAKARAEVLKEEEEVSIMDPVIPQTVARVVHFLCSSMIQVGGGAFTLAFATAAAPAATHPSPAQRS